MSRKFITLNEAIEFVNDLSDDEEYKVVVLPPENQGEVTDEENDDENPAPINSRLNVVVRSPAPFGLGRNGCWPSRGSQLPRALPIHFLAMLPPERPQKGSTQHL